MAYVTIITYFLDLICWPQGIYGGDTQGWVGQVGRVS